MPAYMAHPENRVTNSRRREDLEFMITKRKMRMSELKQRKRGNVQLVAFSTKRKADKKEPD